MKAHLNYGRWIVACPAEDCLAWLTADKTVCDCHDDQVCDHQQIPCGQPVEVVFPEDRETIDQLTTLRPKRANRNWQPGETLDDLKADNLRHGVSV